MMCLRRRASLHSVHDRALFFACGDDDYLFILIFRSWKVRAIATPDPATATAAATAAIAAQLLSARVCSVLCCSLVPSAHGPHRSWTAAPCAQLLAAGVGCDK